MANKRMTRNIGLGEKGKYLEGKLREALQGMKRRLPLFYYRFPDARSAGKTTSSSPCDYLVKAGANAWLIEAKESEKYACFSECYRAFLKTKQGKTEVANIRLWLRTDGLAGFLFYSHVNDRVQFWEARQVILALYDEGEIGSPIHEFELGAGRAKKITDALQKELEVLLFP